MATFLERSIYVVTLHEIVTRGVISARVESGFARFARSITKIGVSTFNPSPDLFQ